MFERARWSRRVGVVAVAAALLAVASCASAPAAPPNPIAVEQVPDYYPADYQQIIEGSKAEGGELVINSGTAKENWAPIFRDFQKKYPWVESILAKESGAEGYQQLLNEIATDSVQTDLMVVSSTQGWNEFAAHEGALAEYRSPEADHLPEFAELLPNVYAMSLDPMGMVYNTALISSDLTSLADLADYAAAHPGELDGKVTVREGSTPFGFTVAYAWTEWNPKNPDAKATFEKLLPLSRAETSSGIQIEKVLSGEYAAGFLISSALGYEQEERSGGLVKFVLPKDGTLLLGRGAGIIGKAPHPNTARLFLDFLLSEEGQRAVAEGGLTAYRDGIEGTQGLRTYQDLVKEVGDDSIVVVPFDMVPQAEVEQYIARFAELLPG
ncbi:ABC transporter substrate-binding protein [Pseudonocardia alaniniphila]|uniref:ABC transporter substrate-binding protein n=1 Tax=Pseudonocardia alaniniphila TaxID=75291 RepID=A0ABS9TRF7_9PSEU|nr:ABC transporter substrate-binding protein [Pseudonocardia alaniniphila]MCH6171138.1 ABC transporter substrate-binding protein [Pseudonocardia alaniniphila]